MSIEAMNEAWYLEKQKNPHTAFNSWCRGYEAGVKAIEQAEKQEPVPVGMTCKVWTHGCALFDGIDLPNETLLYTAPQHKKWVGLTDDDLRQIILASIGVAEAKLKEKNT